MGEIIVCLKNIHIWLVLECYMQWSRNTNKVRHLIMRSDFHCLLVFKNNLLWSRGICELKKGICWRPEFLYFQVNVGTLLIHLLLVLIHIVP